MHLIRLEIIGFKSFADKISLDFNSGITAVVGPNGSGKSNIADAVRWVLGEQSTKTLRGNKMEDVIFSGTQHRKPLGFAEVTMILDNSDKKLPIEYSEVSVARRIYRSGESEFFINKTSCRLKDIHELFLDTGIGKEGYSIIGQGRIGEILSNRSEDRRHIFEEASGIMKYKVRKVESERKLELTKQNLLRINDIISELELQLEPLHEQSETAKKYLNIRDTLKELEVNVYIENISKLKSKISEYEEQCKDSGENIESKSVYLEEVTDSNKQKNELLKQLEQKLDKTRQEFYEFENSIEKYNSEIKLNEEKISNSTLNITRIKDEIKEITGKMGSFDKEVSAKQEKVDYLNSNLQTYLNKLQEAEQKLASVVALLSESEKNLEEINAKIMDKLNILSDKKTEKNNAKGHIDTLKGRMTAIKDEIKNIQIDKDKDAMKVEDLTENIEKANAKIKVYLADIEKHNNEKQKIETNLEELKNNRDKLTYDSQTKESKLKTLQDMEDRLEGYNHSVRLVLESYKQGKGIHGAIAQIITADKNYEKAIEVSLGSIVQHIVTNDKTDVHKAIDYLKENKLGKATFLPISEIKTNSINEKTVDKIKSTKGFCGFAADFVTAKKEYKQIIDNLLGNVIVVEDLDCAMNVNKLINNSYTIVTVEGDMIGINGAITGGSIEEKGTGILGRNREITELAKDINKIKKEIEINENNIAGAINSIGKLQSDILSFDTEIRKIELVRATEESQLELVSKNLEKIIAKAEILKNEEKETEKEEADTKEKIKNCEVEMLELEKEIENLKQTVIEHNLKNKDDRTAKDLIYNDITNYKISVNSFKESIESVGEDIQRIKGEKEISENITEKKKNDIARIEDDINKLGEKNVKFNELLKETGEKNIQLKSEIDNIVEQREKIEEELNETLEKLNESSNTIAMMKDAQNRIEIKMEKAKTEMEAIQNRMWDEYELTYTNALELKKDIGSVTQAQKKINELKEEIRELGPVNVAAIEDYIKTKERYEFMTIQRDDMEMACEKLYKVISEMKVIMKKQFTEQFKLINENFDIVFKKLFDGGRAELTLTDKENILESGIEIEAQPPGKKLKNLAALSGGEQAFTAIALLFAILKLKPTPFCILDEIDTSLDDANVYRFADYIKEYTKKTQFIIVTHRKGTMESSDTLYGVTMQEHGISKIISMKMDKKVG